MDNFYLKRLRPLPPLLGEIDTCSRVFCRKLNYGQLLFKAFFDFVGNLAALSPKVNALSHFSTLYKKHNNLSSPLAPLLEEIGTCALWVFCRKLNYGPLLFEVFFDFTGNFGSIKPLSECTFPLYCIIIF